MNQLPTTPAQTSAEYYGPRPPSEPPAKPKLDYPITFWVCLVLTTVFSAVTALSTGFMAYVLYRIISALHDLAQAWQSAGG